MTDYAPWELQGWRDIYEDRDANGNEALAVCESDGRTRYLYRMSGSGKIGFSAFDAGLIKKQPPRMYACLHRNCTVGLWSGSKRDTLVRVLELHGAKLLSRPADADPMDFMQWRVEE